MKDNKSEDIITSLAVSDPKSYGPDHQKHLLEIYKDYAQTVDGVSNRRQKANSFFLSLNTAVIALIGYAQSFEGVGEASVINLLVPAAGVFICYTWYRVIRSYSGLNSGKFDVILALEDYLPVRPFKAEWKALGEGKKPKRFKPLGMLESTIPWGFILIHLTIICFSIYKSCFG